MVAKVSAATKLRIAELCCEYYLTIGSTRPSVAEIAAAVGVSDRTFYRYFATKADSIGPVFDEMTTQMNTVLAGSPSADTRTALIEAFDAMFLSPATSRARELFPLVFADPEMWALFLRKVHDGETALVPFLADRLRIPVDSDRARAASAAVASATRIALERLCTHSADLETEFRGVLDAFGPDLLRPHLSADHSSVGTPQS